MCPTFAAYFAAKVGYLYLLLFMLESTEFSATTRISRDTWRSNWLLIPKILCAISGALLMAQAQRRKRFSSPTTRSTPARSE